MRIERLVPCPPKELWWALIENAEATERGVMLRLALPGGVSQVAGKITRYESPTLLRPVHRSCRQKDGVPKHAPRHGRPAGAAEHEPHRFLDAIGSA